MAKVEVGAFMKFKILDPICNEDTISVQLVVDPDGDLCLFIDDRRVLIVDKNDLDLRIYIDCYQAYEDLDYTFKWITNHD